MWQHWQLVAVGLAVLIGCACAAAWWLHAYPWGRSVLVTYVLTPDQPAHLASLEYFAAEAIADDRRCQYVILVPGGSADEVRVHMQAVSSCFVAGRRAPWQHSGAVTAGPCVQRATRHPPAASQPLCQRHRMRWLRLQCPEWRGGACLQDVRLPPLPSHAQYIKLPESASQCKGAWAAWGWLLLRSGQVSYRRFRHLVLLTSAARGPFMPAYARVGGRGGARLCTPHAMPPTHPLPPAAW